MSTKATVQSQRPCLWLWAGSFKWGVRHTLQDADKGAVPGEGHCGAWEWRGHPSGGSGPPSFSSSALRSLSLPFLFPFLLLNLMFAIHPINFLYFFFHLPQSKRKVNCLCVGRRGMGGTRIDIASSLAGKETISVPLISCQRAERTWTQWGRVKNIRPRFFSYCVLTGIDVDAGNGFQHHCVLAIFKSLIEELLFKSTYQEQRKIVFFSV